MNEISWKLDWSPAICPPVRVLQRPIIATGELEEDLEPFRSEVARWQFDRLDATVTAIGFLAATRLTSIQELYLVRDVHGEEYEFDFSGQTERVLTIWRVAEHLDMLQLRLRRGPESLTAQVGGSVALPILARLAGDSSTTSVSRDVLELYRSGQPPESSTD
ncbi:MAG TPA: hypothetical protein VLJ80_08355 [Solirubrobacteraceae bacterium]|nr:hypothetical protein [Solirubrobacteraceae bacterium]